MILLWVFMLAIHILAGRRLKRMASNGTGVVNLRQMRCLSLKAGLSWLIAAVLGATLLIDVAILMIHAGPRMRAEAESYQRLTRELIVTALSSLQETEDPRPALRRLFESLRGLRHVDIKIVAADDPTLLYGPRSKARSGEEIPDWFVSLIDPPPRITFIPVMIRGKHYGRIAIVSNPIDELEEVWSDMSWLTVASLLATTTILAFVLLLLRYSLAPFDALRAGLADLDAGKAGVRIPLRGAAEFRSIANALNSLATTLDCVKEENRTLIFKLIQVQDGERREIARDLHDDAGPALFSIRAGAVALQDLMDQATPDLVRMRQVSGAVEKASEALQALFRGLLGRLRPNGLAEFGLNEAVKGLIASWKERHPEVSLELIAPHDLSVLDETLSLTAYRIVQEGLTNVFRHAEAHWASIRIEFGATPESTGDADCETTPVLRVIVEDDGVGVPQQRNYGLGLLGMRERVAALKGTISIENREGQGTRISAALPLPEDDEE